jgi:hypothetical protein
MSLGRRFVQVLIVGKSPRVLPVYIHCEAEKQSWLVTNYPAIIEELARLLADHIDDIEDKVWNDSSSELDRSRYGSLITGSDLLCFVYNVDRRKPRYVLLSENSPSSTADTSYISIPILPFTIRVWIYPAAEKSKIPVEFTI